MNMRILHRGPHITASVLALLAATVIAVGVIPDVRSDKLASSAAVPAFWVNVVWNVLVAVAILAGTFMVPGIGRRMTLGIASAVAFILALSLLDAAAAFSTHGPGLSGAAARTLLCALADLAAGTLIVLVALLRRVSRLVKKRELTGIAQELVRRRPGTTLGDNWDDALDSYRRRHDHRSDVVQGQSITPPTAVDKDWATSQPVGSRTSRNNDSW